MIEYGRPSQPLEYATVATVEEKRRHWRGSGIVQAAFSIFLASVAVTLRVVLGVGVYHNAGGDTDLIILLIGPVILACALAAICFRLDLRPTALPAAHICARIGSTLGWLTIASLPLSFMGI